MAPRYEHGHVGGGGGIRLGQGHITIEIGDKRDKRIGSVEVSQQGVSIGGKRGRRKLVSRWNDLGT